MPRLAQILEDQLAEAKAKAGTKIVRRLSKGGLRVELTAADNQVTITLTRYETFPSMQEWDTIIKYFPYDTPRILPTPIQQGGRYTITGKVPSQRMARLKFG